MSTTAERHSSDTKNVTIDNLEDESVVNVHGNLDLDTARTVSGAIVEAARRHRRIVVDCTDVTFIDSVGLGVLLRADKLWGDDPGFALKAPNPPVRRLLASK